MATVLLVFGGAFGPNIFSVRPVLAICVGFVGCVGSVVLRLSVVVGGMGLLCVVMLSCGGCCRVVAVPPVTAGVVVA